MTVSHSGSELRFIVAKELDLLLPKTRQLKATVLSSTLCDVEGKLRSESIYIALQVSSS